MNPARSEPSDYVNFPVAAPRSCTCAEAARCQTAGPDAPAHDAFTRLLRRQPPDTAARWQETRASHAYPLCHCERSVAISSA